MVKEINRFVKRYPCQSCGLTWWKSPTEICKMCLKYGIGNCPPHLVRCEGCGCCFRKTTLGEYGLCGFCQNDYLDRARKGIFAPKSKFDSKYKKHGTYKYDVDRVDIDSDDEHKPVYFWYPKRLGQSTKNEDESEDSEESENSEESDGEKTKEGYSKDDFVTEDSESEEELEEDKNNAEEDNISESSEDSEEKEEIIKAKPRGKKFILDNDTSEDTEDETVTTKPRQRKFILQDETDNKPKFNFKKQSSRKLKKSR